jgi:hypothetical protein
MRRLDHMPMPPHLLADKVAGATGGSKGTHG